MKQAIKRYDVTQCALYKCGNKRRLEYLLNLKKYDLNRINSIIKYNQFQRDKKGTDEKRDILAPCRNLKLIQTRILSLINKLKRPDWLMSGEKGKCYIDNGKSHLLSNYVLTIDIKKFYDNCKREAVYRFFKDYLKTTGDVAGVLTDIVTYNHGIPTGCPTSQLIAYYAYRNMFKEINNIAQSYGCKFTLYVDDMTFSSIVPFKNKELANDIDIILRKYGHKPKYPKVRFYSKKYSKPITGTIVTYSHQLEVPNNLQKKIYENFHEIKNIKSNIDLTSEQEKLLLSLKGQLQAAKNINNKIFPEIGRVVGLIANSRPQNSKRKMKLIQSKNPYVASS